jgi:hypothetical protein
MSLASYNFIKGVNISNITDIVASAANLLALLGQINQTSSLITSALKVVFKYYESTSSTIAYFAYAASVTTSYSSGVLFAAIAASYSAEPYSISNSTVVLSRLFTNTFDDRSSYPEFKTVMTAYNSNTTNFRQANTCAAGLIYLSVYSLFTGNYQSTQPIVRVGTTATPPLKLITMTRL